MKGDAELQLFKRKHLVISTVVYGIMIGIGIGVPYSIYKHLPSIVDIAIESGKFLPNWVDYIYWGFLVFISLQFIVVSIWRWTRENFKESGK